MDEINNGGTGTTCKCQHHKVFPVLVVLFGLGFLLNNLDWLSDTILATSWPVLVIVAGAMKMMEGKCKCCWGYKNLRCLKIPARAGIFVEMGGYKWKWGITCESYRDC